MLTVGRAFWMAGLPVSHTYSRNKTVDAIRAGNLSNIRLMAGSSGEPVLQVASPLL